MADTTGVLARLQAALSVYDPSWDVSVGTATYKILEAVAQEIAYANNNSILQTYSYDVNTKFGPQLDAFCNLFGVYRQQGKRAVGTVNFTINTPSPTVVDIPVGTQVAIPIGTNYPTAIVYATTAPAIIGIGDTNVLVPVTAVLPGSNGNAPANVINTLITPNNLITSVTNTSAMTGGADPESDAQLQSRWTNTVFNNNTGTPGMYAVTALQDNNVSLVNTVSQQNFYSEQLQVNSFVSGTTNSGSITFSLIAYSGQKVNNVTYTGTTYVVSSGLLWSTTSSGVQAALNTMISGVYPSLSASGFAFTATSGNSTNTIASGIYISANMASPYRLAISGSSLVSSGTNAGAYTISGATTSGSTYTFYDYIVSNNPDVGYSGTLSFNGISGQTFGSISGYFFPQGNELLGSNLNTFNQITYANKTDYYYPTTPTIPLKINISNSALNQNLFIGNTPQLISEYNAASSRSQSLTSGNYVDIFINGTTGSITNEQTVFNPNFTLSSGNSTSYLNSVNYVLASGAIAATNSITNGNYYIPLNVQPVINFPSQFSVASSGTPDTFYIYNTSISSGVVYPIANNPPASATPITFTTGAISSSQAGGTFLPIAGTVNSNIVPGMIIGCTVVNYLCPVSGSGFYVTGVTTSGIYLNKGITGAASGTNLTFTVSGVVAAYPLYDNTNLQGSIQSITGLALYSGANNIITGWPAFPTSTTWVAYAHSYNEDVTTVETLTQQARPFGSNTLVHQAEFINVVPNMRIVFSNGYSVTTAQANILNQLDAYFSNISYLGTISFADIASQVLSVAGVANVRMISINTVALDGTVTNTYTKDFNLASNQLPNLYNIGYTITGASNF